MKHLFTNCDGERVAADTAEQAGRYYDCELGGATEPSDEWEQLPDESEVTIEFDPPARTITKTAKEWAAEESKVAIVSTTYA